MRTRSQAGPASSKKTEPALPEKEPAVDDDATPEAAPPKRRRKSKKESPYPESAPTEPDVQTDAASQEPAGESLEASPEIDAEIQPPKIDQGEAAELRMGAGFDDIIDKLFDYDVGVDYAKILKALILDMKASRAEYGHLLDALDQAEENARKGLQIVANAKVSRKAYEAECSVIEASLHAAAVQALEAEVDAGKRQKRYTKDDVQAYKLQHYHDEYRDLEIGRAKVRATEEYLEGLSRTVQERARDLRAMVQGSSRH